MDPTTSDIDANLDSLLFDEWNDTQSNKTADNVGDGTWQNKSDNSLFNNTSVNSSINRLDVSALCCNEELNGFDKNAGPTWIYPTNYPVRHYQLNIISNALFKNTLVSLPTGLGKTFIAAVLMYNYYRWYPLGKIVFTAPTRPLVAQQIDACYNITAIPHEHTVEMTGTMQVNARKIAWKQKRVFFATPQVVNNDLESGICPGELIRCLVIDEAHRAKGKHAYCQLVEGLTLKGHTLLRILALSATPGSKVEDVITVVKNLHISHLELRSEQCIDVSMYSHSRKMDTVIVPLGDELANIRSQFVEIMDIYTRRLVQYRILNGNVSGLSKGKIVMLYKEFQNKEKSQRHPQHNWIMQDFTTAITLYHALELLTKHGSRVFLNFFDERTDKQWVGKDDNLTCFLERLRDDLGVDPFSINRNTLPDGSVPEIKEDLKFGHPKFDHLKKIIVDHFLEAEKKKITTKAIVFCEYRESVNLVHCLLLQCRPMIEPHVFIGQRAGTANTSKESNLKAFSQKQQLKVMKMFRENKCNVLVSTCIGEEGLDVGSVDLIICFDISNKSPIRLVQRCGRTGREREGRVVILVTEGKEHQTLRECILQRDSFKRRVLQSKELVKNLYTACPRMIPQNLKPTRQDMFFTIQKPVEEEKTEKPNKIQSKIKDMFKSRKDTNDLTGSSLTSEEFNTLYPNGLPNHEHIRQCVEHWNKPKDYFQANSSLEDSEKHLKLSEWLEWQRTLQYTVNVDHSVDSEILIHILKMADSKRFDPPSTQQDEPTMPEPMQSKKKSPVKITNKIQSKAKIKSFNNDIRAMFHKMHKTSEEIVFDKKADEIFEDCGLQGDDINRRNKMLEEDGITSAMINLMVHINIEQPDWKTKKHHRLDSHECFKKQSENRAVLKCLSNHFILPSISILDSLPNLQSIDTANFERILRLQDCSKKNLNKSIDDVNKVRDKTVASEINFCDDSLLRENDHDFAFENSIKLRTENQLKESKEMMEDKPDVDPSINKIMNNDDFDIGNIDDVFEDSDDFVDNNCDNKLVSNDNCGNKLVSNDNCGNKLVSNDNCANKLVSNDNCANKLVSNDNCANKLVSNDNCANKLVSNDNCANKLVSNDNCANKLVSNDNCDEIEDEQFKNKIVFEDDFEFGDIDDIFENTDEDIPKDDFIAKECDTSKEKNLVDSPTKTDVVNPSKTVPANPLSFFGLEDIDDLFVNDDFSEQDNNEVVGNGHDCVIDPPDSPILFSQKISSTNTKNHVTSTPFMSNSLKKSTNLKSESDSMMCKDVSILSTSFYKNSVKKEANSKIAENCSFNATLNKTDNKSSFTITQIIDLVNKENEKTQRNKAKDDEPVSDGSNESVILCSQIPKPIKKIIQPKSSLTILETSESSEDDDDTSTVKTNEQKSNHFQSDRPSVKRKLISSEDEFEASPFFQQRTTSPLIKRNKMSLKEKIDNSTMNGFNRIEKPQTSSMSNGFLRDKSYSEVTKKSTVVRNEFKNPVKLQSRLTQFSLSKPSQWSVNDAQMSKNQLKASNGEKEIVSSEDDDFEQTSTPRRNRVIRRKERKKKPCQFIDYEAALSDDSYRDSGDDDEHSPNGDTSIIQFICDEEEEEENHNEKDVDMQAKYLQSVRSPVKRQGQFKIPAMKPRKPDSISIFSQADPDEHANYVLDSFCVDDHILSQRPNNDMSELDLAEAILKKRKRRRKRASSENGSPVKSVPCTTNPADDSPIGANRKKRVYQQIHSESSTDDELFL